MQSSNQSAASHAMLVQQKFRSKTQLHQYLTQRLRVFLPPKSSCRMEFLLDVFSGKKNVLHCDNVPHYAVPSDPNVCVKILFPELIQDEELMSFFDTDRYTKSQKLPPKPYFWGIMFAMRKDFVEALLNEVMAKKVQGSQEKEQALAQVQFDTTWMNKLMEYPIHHSAGARNGNIFAQIGKAKKPCQRKAIELPATVRDYQQQLSQHIERQKNVTVRKQPNIIGNAREQEDLQ